MTMDVTKEIADSNAPVLAANASDTAVPPAVQKDTSTVSEDDESFNDGPGAPCEGEESAVQGVEVPKPANTEPSLTAPTATDFPRVTTRYMIAGREWTRTNRNLALEALGRAVVEWSGLFQLTLWIWNGYKPKGGTPDKPGSGKDFKTTIERYGKWLADKANRVRPKGQLASVTLGGSRYGGSFDDECTARTGIFLDSDDNGGWNEVRALSRSVGLAFVAQMRPAKPESHHFEVPVAKPWLPERDANGNVGDWKLKVYRPQLGWIMGVFSELAELRSDLAWEGGLPTAVHSGYDTACDRLLQLNFLYHLRPDDPPALVPVTDWASGGALDVEMLLSLTGFEAARERLERTGGSVASGSPSTICTGGGCRLSRLSSAGRTGGCSWATAVLAVSTTHNVQANRDAIRGSIIKVTRLCK